MCIVHRISLSLALTPSFPLKNVIVQIHLPFDAQVLKHDPS